MKPRFSPLFGFVGFFEMAKMGFFFCFRLEFGLKIFFQRGGAVAFSLKVYSVCNRLGLCLYLVNGVKFWLKLEKERNGLVSFYVIGFFILPILK